MRSPNAARNAVIFQASVVRNYSLESRPKQISQFTCSSPVNALVIIFLSIINLQTPVYKTQVMLMLFCDFTLIGSKIFCPIENCNDTN